jgi:formate transporter
MNKPLFQIGAIVVFKLNECFLKKTVELKMNSQKINLDALMPLEMAAKASSIGVKKAKTGWKNVVMLALLAGFFISLGAIFYTTTITTTGIPLAFGINKLVGGLTFCLGLILVVIAGAELFTGNNLIVMSLASGQVTLIQLLKNWVLVYLGNFLGAIGAVLLIFISRQYLMAEGQVGLSALKIANAKCDLAFFQAIALGIICNSLVCLAVWLCFSARSTTDKIMSIIFPITAFVAIGSEHCIANMYFIPIGMMIKNFAPASYWLQIGFTPADFPKITLENFLVSNLLPVTIGNIIGGTLFVGLIYWFIYVRPSSSLKITSD